MTKKVLNQVDVKIGARVRLRRMQLDRSQEWLAHKLGLTFQQVQKYEKGMNRVGGSRMQQIAAALEVTAGYFFEDVPGASTGDAGADADVRSFVSSREGLAIIVAWPLVKPKMKSAITGLVMASLEA